jgi:hypothetical protein
VPYFTLYNRSIFIEKRAGGIFKFLEYLKQNVIINFKVIINLLFQRLHFYETGFLQNRLPQLKYTKYNHMHEG